MNDEYILSNINQIYKDILNITRQVISLTEKFGLVNSQEFMDFQDGLNELSIYEYGNKN